MSKQHPKKKKAKRNSCWLVVGIDISMSSMALAGISYDHVLKKIVGPKCLMHRWERKTDYYDRLEDAALGSNFIIDLMAELRVALECEEVFIAIEEPWPYGAHKRMEGSYLKQQAEINGAFKGGLIRYGFNQIYEINNVKWRKFVADALGITTHYKSWNPNGEGKFRAKEWVYKCHPEWKIPEWPDLINSKDGLKPKPEESRAKPVQSDDRYESLAMMEALREELIGLGTIS